MPAKALGGRQVQRGSSGIISCLFGTPEPIGVLQVQVIQNNSQCNAICECIHNASQQGMEFTTYNTIEHNFITKFTTQHAGGLEKQSSGVAGADVQQHRQGEKQQEPQTSQLLSQQS